MFLPFACEKLNKKYSNPPRLYAENDSLDDP